jgi:hypothetical protein
LQAHLTLAFRTSDGDGDREMMVMFTMMVTLMVMVKRMMAMITMMHSPGLQS